MSAAAPLNDLFAAFSAAGAAPPLKKHRPEETAPPALTNPASSDNAPAAPRGAVIDEVLLQTIACEENCVHECARPRTDDPKKNEFNPPEGKPPARLFSYKLDPFQSRAVSCLEAGESLLVSAHTSAGKTTVAEYAIAMALRDKQRVVYTSPIKALSNQKFRDLNDLYREDVGLLTGDVTLNPEASIVVMTTEVLRSMLYRGSELAREMKWVIFDEIHYMRDRERGVVWEESIILLPESARLVFLSATIPNAREFAEWICRVKRQPCHVIYTDYRPVPLQHFIFPCGGDGVFMIMDQDKKFQEKNFYAAMMALNSDDAGYDPTTGGFASQPPHRHGGSKATGPGGTDVERIIRMCQEKKYVPIIVFSFSKKQVEANATSLRNVKLTTPEEEKYIEEVYTTAMATLGEEKDLPQISCILPMLKRGIGVHHGGLLPIVKEVIEILFQESLVKVLFSTETFSMGINMPAKTVVFTSLRKFDGREYRLISPGEYIQMSGRAGRRGLDDRGVVIVMLNEKMKDATAHELFLGSPMEINSAFHLGFNMLLNLLRVEGATPEFMVRRSFYQFQRDRRVLQLQERRRQLFSNLASATESLSQQIKSRAASQGALEEGEEPEDVPGEAQIGEYYAALKDAETIKKQIRQVCFTPELLAPFVTPGRILKVADENGNEWGYGVSASTLIRKASSQGGRNKGATSGGSVVPSSSEYYVLILLPCDPKTVPDGVLFQAMCPGPPDFSSELAMRRRLRAKIHRKEEPPVKWEIVEIPLTQVLLLTQAMASMELTMHSTSEHKQELGSTLRKLVKKLKGQVPALQPIEHLQCPDVLMPKLLSDLAQKESEIEHHPLHNDPKLVDYLLSFEQTVSLSSTLRAVEVELEREGRTALEEELRVMRKILVKLGYVGEGGVVTAKGRAACEISAAHEIVVAELLFTEAFNLRSTHADQLAALLSVFVFDEKADTVVPQHEPFASLYNEVMTCVNQVATVFRELDSSFDNDRFKEQFKPVLLEITQRWVSGALFKDLGIPDDMFEGAVVRALRRLEELIRQLACAAKAIGDGDMERRMVETVQKMRRGIVFSASLYL